VEVPGDVAEGADELVGGYVDQLHEKDMKDKGFWADIMALSLAEERDWNDFEQKSYDGQDREIVKEYVRPGTLLHSKYHLSQGR
jgi:asparagine synthetase B (glutamine-hydrolysing)